MNERQSGREVTALAGGVFLVSITALVILQLQGKDPTILVSIVGPVLAALFVVGHVDRRTDEQNVKIDRIEEQTNGVLVGRIRSGVRAELLAHSYAPAHAEPPAEAPSSSTMPPDWIDTPRGL